MAPSRSREQQSARSGESIPVPLCTTILVTEVLRSPAAAPVRGPASRQDVWASADDTGVAAAAAAFVAATDVIAAAAAFSQDGS